ncbi:MAG: CAP domain-containing protein [Anaerolineae bacterium]
MRLCSRTKRSMAEAGYDWTTWGEIIACGAIADASEVVDLWMDSPGHRAIILSSSYADFGVGYVSDPGSEWGRYWTVDLCKSVSEWRRSHPAAYRPNAARWLTSQRQRSCSRPAVAA